MPSRLARAFVLGITLASMPSFSPALAVATASQLQQHSDLRSAAETAYAEAKQLFAQGTPDSRRKAIQKAEEALALFKRLGDRGKEAELLVGLGSAYLQSGTTEAAADYLGQALPLVHSLGNSGDEATALLMLGSVYESSKDLKRSEDYYQQALVLCRGNANRQGEATALMAIGRVSFAAGDKQKALAYFGQASPLWQALGNKNNQASSLYLQGILNSLLGDRPKAIPYYQQALPLYRQLGDHQFEALTEFNLADAYSASADQQSAREHYDEAIPLLHAVGEQAKEATALVGRGTLRESWGDRQGALADLTLALALFQSRDKIMEATLLMRLGTVHFEVGDKEKALDLFERALQLARALHDPVMEGATLTGISAVYGSLGDDTRAFGYSEQAFKLLQVTNNHPADPNALYRLGVTYQSLGTYQKALECFTQELSLERNVGNRTGEAEALDALGGVYRTQGDYSKALDFYQHSLEIREHLTDRQAKATTLNSVGIVYEELGQVKTALNYYLQALKIRQAVHDYAGESETLFWMARAEQILGDLKAATDHVQQSLAITESLRTKIFSTELRTSYFATVQQAYELEVDVLMQLHLLNPGQGYDIKAFEAHERAKARGLLDLLTEARVDIRQGVEPEMLIRERALRQLLESKQAGEIQLLSGEHAIESLAPLQRELADLRTQYEQLQAQIRMRSPTYAALTQAWPLRLSSIQTEVLDADTLLLEFAVGEKRSYLWVITPSSVNSFQLAGRSEIQILALRFYRMIIGRQPSAPGELERTAAALSQIILAPAKLLLGTKRLLIVGDEVLQVVPFAALPSPDSDRPLLLTHEIAYLPSVSSLALLRSESAGRQRAPKILAVLADPVFEREDKRITSGQLETKGALSNSRTWDLETAGLRGLGLERLPFTRKEADAITRLVPTQSRIEAVDFMANKSLATSPVLRDYRIVHFATHGIANPAHPELSGIVLSLVGKNGDPQDGFLRLNDLFNLKLRADLVVLSACQTGLGEEVRGEGLIGLTRGFMYAGVARVVVSLWSVNDQATAELMERFYAGILGKQRLRIAAALRQAQIAMWEQQKWRAPFFWAAFVLQGEWK